MELTNFDLQGFAEKGAKLEIWHPVELKPLKDVVNPITENNFEPIFLSVLGHDSSQYVEAVRSEARAASNGNNVDPLESQQRIFASLVCGWSGITENGKELPYSKENSIYMLKKYNWIAVQVKAFCEDRANFFLSEKSEKENK